jgi:hypothetical protein
MFTLLAGNFDVVVREKGADLVVGRLVVGGLGAGGVAVVLSGKVKIRNNLSCLN